MDISMVICIFLPLFAANPGVPVYEKTGHVRPCPHESQPGGAATTAPALSRPGVMAGHAPPALSWSEATVA
jgi:hypothetical protein